MIIITKTMKSKSKKQFSTGSQNWPSSLQQSHVLVTYYQVPSLKKARFQVVQKLRSKVNGEQIMASRPSSSHGLNPIQSMPVFVKSVS